jgi:hypothetical protein
MQALKALASLAAGAFLALDDAAGRYDAAQGGAR